MKFNYTIKKLNDLAVLSLFTYSASILMLVQKFYDEKIFVEIALFFAIFVGFFTIFGGSVRMSLKHNENDISIFTSIFVLRIYLLILIFITVFLLDFNTIVILILLRKTTEWSVDSIITFYRIKNNLVSMSIILIDAIILLILFFNYDFMLLNILWVITPLIYALLAINSHKLKLKLFFNLKETIKFIISNYLHVIGFEGPAALTSIIFRYCINIHRTSFLVDVLFLTVIFSSITNIFFKIVVPTFKNIRTPKFVLNTDNDFLIFTFLFLLIFISMYLDNLSFYHLIILYLICFLAQIIALLNRKRLIELARINTILYIEIILAIILNIMLLFVLTNENSSFLFLFYILNSILNWILYKKNFYFK